MTWDVCEEVQDLNLAHVVGGKRWYPVSIPPKGHDPIATFLIDLFPFLFLEGNKLERGRKKKKKEYSVLKKDGKILLCSGQLCTFGII